MGIMLQGIRVIEYCFVFIFIFSIIIILESLHFFTLKYSQGI